MSESSFRITKVEEKEVESTFKTREQMVDATKGITPGKPVLGVVGEVTVKPEIVGEQLSVKEKKEKSELKKFLLKHITPPEINSRAKPEQNMAALVRKLDRQTLGDLKRFWSDAIPSDEQVTDDMKEQLQKTWDEISP